MLHNCGNILESRKSSDTGMLKHALYVSNSKHTNERRPCGEQSDHAQKGLKHVWQFVGGQQFHTQKVTQLQMRRETGIAFRFQHWLALPVEQTEPVTEQKRH